ncbi:MAG: VCBS repeat-containing protein [Planctomycetes bacterium]|nr:VCBS repeat-containing protein [Planctomycetota bacterium]
MEALLSHRGPMLAAGLAIFALSTGLAAQDPFGLLTTRAVETYVPSSGKPACGDIDGDGDQDLLIPSVIGQDHLFVNDGDGVFRDVTGSRLPPFGGWSHSATFVDVDGDGDQDLLIAGNSGYTNRGEQNRLLLNDGSGSFTDVTPTQLPVDQDKTMAITAADVDGDGDPDLLVLNNGSSFGGNPQNRLYLNDGTGHFTDVTATHLPAQPGSGYHLSVGDLDGDGDLDFVTAVLFDTPPLRIHNNDGTGRFSPTRNGQLPAGIRNANNAHLVDVEGDGDLDMVGFVNQSMVVLVNDGSGNFADQSGQRLPRGFAFPVLGRDFDGDGDVDFVVSTLSGGALMRNDGTGVFGLPVAISSLSEVASDVDGDGDLDLVVPQIADVLLNDGNAVFFDRAAAERRGPDISGSPGRAALADVDGDGDLDAWLTSFAVDADRMLLNDGRGVFTDSPTPLPLAGELSSAVAFGDVDGDGDQDVIVGSSMPADRSRLLLGDGRGGFVDATTGRLPQSSAQTLALALFDADADGDLDLVEGNFYQSSALLLNDGSGTFSRASAGAFPIDQSRSRGVLVVDVDLDGDGDLVFANYFEPASLYLNDGTGRFQDVSATHLPSTALGAFDVGSADFDGDGAPDLVFVGDARGNCPSLMLNRGGVFVDATGGNLPASVPGLWVHCIDHDQDGDFDLVAGDRDVVHLLENDGRARFTLRQDLGRVGHLVTVGDVDSDGDVDLFVATEDGPSGVVTNLRRQMHFARLVRPGRRTRIDVYAVGRPNTVGFAVPALAPLPSRIPIAGLGVFGLDPATTIVGPLLPLPAGSEVGSLSVAVPPDPSLHGASLFGQALLFDSQGVSLTNTQAVRVVL